MTLFRSCDYCHRGAAVTIYLSQGVVRTALGLPRRARRVCMGHVARAQRPGAWRA